jgi:hypothetical protein
MLFIARFATWLGKHLGWSPFLTGVVVVLATLVWCVDFWNHFGRTFKYFRTEARQNERRQTEERRKTVEDTVGRSARTGTEGR